MIVPTYSFIATAEAVSTVGATPVLVDVDAETGADHGRDRRAGADAAHALRDPGPPLRPHRSRWTRSSTLCRERGIAVIEDACQAHGALYRGRPVGSLGDAGCFSFYPTKNLGGWGDGGALVTNDAELADKVRLLRSHGEGTRHHHELATGTHRLDALQAAILDVKLRHLDDWNAAPPRRPPPALRRGARRQRRRRCRPPPAADGDHVYHLFVVRHARARRPARPPRRPRGRQRDPLPDPDPPAARLRRPRPRPRLAAGGGAAGRANTARCRSSRRSRTGTSPRPPRRCRALAQPATAERAGVKRAPRGLRVCMVHYSDFAVDSRIQRQARALAERGDQVDCVCLGERGRAQRRRGQHRHCTAPRQDKPRGGARAYLEGNARFLAGAARKVSALDRAERFDLVEIHNMPDALVFAALRPKLRGMPLILNFHDTFPELFATLFDRPPDHPLVRLIRVEERISAALANGHVFVTEEARELLRRARHRRQAHPGRDEHPRRARLRRAPRGRARRRARASCGSSTTAAWPTASGSRRWSARWRCCAGAASRSRSTSTAPTPRRPRASPRSLPRSPPRGCGSPRSRPRSRRSRPALAEADLGVVPTLRDDFTELLLPVKLLEYVHMGLPVVASRLPVIERYFGDDVLLAEPGDAASIAAAIEGVRSRPGGGPRRAPSAPRKRLAEIEWRRQRQGYLELVDGLVAARAERLRWPRCC